MIKNKLLQPFTINNLTLFETLVDHAGTEGVELDKLYKIIKQELNYQREEFIKLSRTNSSGKSPVSKYGNCPLCEAPLFVSAINTGKRNRIEGNYKSMIYCSKEQTCTYHILLS